MRKLIQMDINDIKVVFSNTANQLHFHPSIVEKDFWVCYMLDCLFNYSEFKDAFVFKGGTSLSKSYHVIERFSEDIDLIIDWRRIISDGSNPWDYRSKTKQDQYNKQINSYAADFYKSQLAAALNTELSKTLGEGTWIEIDETDNMVINFKYPRMFKTEYIAPYVRLEIGPLAEWAPSHKTAITPFVAEKYPQFFEQTTTNVLTVDAERTFWEKITILHKIANFPKNKILPLRYARHLYDVYCLARSDIKESALNKKELLEKDITFKQKFYYSKSAHYETATIKEVRLIPAEHIMKELQADYKAMKNMFYGDIPKFDDIICELNKLEAEIHNL